MTIRNSGNSSLNAAIPSGAQMRFRNRILDSGIPVVSSGWKVIVSGWVDERGDRTRGSDGG